jgi:hypothetical protein
VRARAGARCLDAGGLEYDQPGRNLYPDFRLVHHAEGYEVKGLAWPGREANYDANSQVPSGTHRGRDVYYVFGRYPSDTQGMTEYPVTDLVVCHGDFLNADAGYVHKNRSFRGFGSYGDILVRDRKMYVVPTPFALAAGTVGLSTLIVPATFVPQAPDGAGPAVRLDRVREGCLPEAETQGAARLPALPGPPGGALRLRGGRLRERPHVHPERQRQPIGGNVRQRAHVQDSDRPSGRLAAGNNTDQARNWNFRSWRQFFNARQLYSLSLMATAIRDLEGPPAEREALCALFSGTLEFNNLFTSFKGEGTGAVRHMFANHILKPERTPLEAHPWGTPQSSGAFSTLLVSRLERAHKYKTEPVDLVLADDGSVVRVTGLAHAGTGDVATRNAADTGLPDASVDLVITDPPFMDNVHYAELADFFSRTRWSSCPSSPVNVTAAPR